MDRVINEIILCKGLPLRLSVFRNWQDYLRDVIQPRLDLLDALERDSAPAPKKGQAA